MIQITQIWSEHYWCKVRFCFFETYKKVYLGESKFHAVVTEQKKIVCILNKDYKKAIRSQLIDILNCSFQTYSNWVQDHSAQSVMAPSIKVWFIVDSNFISKTHCFFFTNQEKSKQKNSFNIIVTFISKQVLSLHQWDVYKNQLQWTHRVPYVLHAQYPM